MTLTLRIEQWVGHVMVAQEARVSLVALDSAVPGVDLLGETVARLRADVEREVQRLRAE